MEDNGSGSPCERSEESLRKAAVSVIDQHALGCPRFRVQLYDVVSAYKSGSAYGCSFCMCYVSRGKTQGGAVIIKHPINCFYVVETFISMCSRKIKYLIQFILENARFYNGDCLKSHTQFPLMQGGAKSK